MHLANPEPLRRTLGLAHRLDPHLDPVALRWFPFMPIRTRCSANIRTTKGDRWSSVQLVHRALPRAWMAVNPERPSHQPYEIVRALILDIDHLDALDLRELLAELGAPIPDLIICWWNGTAHAVLWLASPVLVGSDAPPKPQRALAYLAALLARALRATVLPYTGLMKNPWGRASGIDGPLRRRAPEPAFPLVWNAYQAAGSDAAWNFVPGSGPTMLIPAIEALAPRFGEEARQHRRPERAHHAREPEGEYLFDHLREWAYANVERDYDAILAAAYDINETLMTAELPCQVRVTAKHVARFMQHRFHPAAQPRHRRDQAAGQGLTAEERRSLSGRVTSAGYRAETDAALAKAWAELQAVGTPITNKALAEKAGLSLRTVAGRRRTLEAASGECKPVPYKDLPRRGSLPATSTPASTSPGPPHDQAHPHPVPAGDTAAATTPAPVQSNIIHADVPPPAPPCGLGGSVRRRSIPRPDARPWIGI